MEIVAAAVGSSGILGGEGQSAFLINGKGVHVAAEKDGLSRSPHGGCNAGAANISGLIAKLYQLIEHIL